MGIPVLKIRRSCDRLIFMIGIPYMGNMVFILRRGPGYQGCQGCSGPGLLGGNKGRWGRQGYAVIFHHSGKDLWASLRIMHIERLFSTLYTQETHQSLRVDTDHRAHNFDSTSLAHTHTDTHTYIYIRFFFILIMYFLYRAILKLEEWLHRSYQT